MNSNRKIVSAFFWKFIERSGNQVAGFLVTLILARILTPQDYGLVALIVVFTSISSTFVQGGFNTALIQTKRASNDDYFTVLCFSLGIATVLYALLYFVSPLIATFYHNSKLISITRILSLILFPSALNSIQVAKVTRSLNFRTLTTANVLSLFFSSIFGIALAKLGAGAWALVAQQLSAQTIVCIALFVLNRWFPVGKFRISSIVRLVPFGSKVLTSDLMVSIFLNLRTLIIGRMYSSQSLGYFNRGKTFPQAFMESINGTVQSVLLPIYSKKQDKPEAIVQMLRTTVQMISYITFPMSFGLVCVADPLVRVLLTDRWLPCVPFVQIFALGYLFNPPQTASSQAYNSLGKSNYSLQIEVIRKSTEMILLLISMQFGVIAIALTTILNGLIGTLATMIMNSRKLGYSIKNQVFDLLPAIFVSMLMSICILTVGPLFRNSLTKLVIQILIGILSYVFISKILSISAFVSIKSNIINVFRQHRK